MFIGDAICFCRSGRHLFAFMACAIHPKALNGGAKPVRRVNYLRSQEAFKWQRVSLSAISRTLT
ncbi:hypothetical protein, partial [Allorhizobium sonneratiae]|uniref:hypothetical protein n=1 Tax=Allorhizobium sonneratiae TaxID=2934936 RepID=UPI00203418B0